MPAPTGANTPLWYKWEPDGLSSDPGTDNAKPFGADATIDTAEGSNEAVRVMAPDSIEAVDIIKTVFSGSWSVSFTLTNPWWLGFIFGEPTETENTDTWDYDWSGSDAYSARIGIGRSGDGHERILKGCVLSSVSVDTTAPEVTTVTLSGAYAEDTTNGSVTAQPAIELPAMRFSDAALALDAGYNLDIVQAAELSVELNANMVNALSSDVAVDFWHGTREPGVDFTEVRRADTNSLEDFYGGTSVVGNEPAQSGLTYSFDSNFASTSTLDLSLGGSFPDTLGESGGDPDELTTTDVNRMAESITAAATTEVQMP